MYRFHISHGCGRGLGCANRSTSSPTAQASNPADPNATLNGLVIHSIFPHFLSFRNWANISRGYRLQLLFGKQCRQFPWLPLLRMLQELQQVVQIDEYAGAASVPAGTGAADEPGYRPVANRRIA